MVPVTTDDTYIYGSNWYGFYPQTCDRMELHVNPQYGDPQAAVKEILGMGGRFWAIEYESEDPAGYEVWLLTRNIKAVEPNLRVV